MTRPRSLGLIALLSLAVPLAGACGSVSTTGELASEQPVGADEPVGVAPTTSTTSTTASTPSSSSTAPAPPDAGRPARRPTPADPLRVLFTGDSIGVEVAAPAMAALGGGGKAITFFVANPSIPRDPAHSALWEARLAESDPDVIVVLVGVWERMGFGRDLLDGGTVEQYRDQVLEPFVDLVTHQGAELVWVSAPPFADPDTNGQIGFLDEAFEGLGSRDRRVEYIDSTGQVAGPGGEFLEIVTGPDGFRERVRRLDGTHLCPGGAVRMAEPLIEYLAGRWDLQVDPGWPVGEWRHLDPFEQATTECPAVG